MKIKMTDNSLTIDSKRGKKLAELLHRKFFTTGIFGRVEMPEDILPKGITRGSLEHLFFITLTVAIDYQRDANVLWEVSRKTWEDPDTQYLFDPEALHLTHYKKVTNDLQKYGLSKKPKKDANIWRTVGITFYKKWNSDPAMFLESCGWESLEILYRLKTDTHIFYSKPVPDYPYLRGDKIGPLWLRMLRDNVGITKLKNLEKVPIPVDIHVARATLCTGIVKGHYSGNLTGLFDYVREAWSESVKGLKLKSRPMIALDVDEPLWHLSKYGCTKRKKESGRCHLIPECEAGDFCIKGRVKIEKNKVELNT